MTQSNKRTAPLPPSLVIPIAVVAAGVAAGVCYLLTIPAGLGQAVPVLVVGPIVGGLVRLLAGGVTRGEAIVVAALALCGAVAGFVLGDYEIWTPFLIGETIRRILSLPGIVVFGATTYLAFIIAVRRGGGD